MYFSCVVLWIIQGERVVIFGFDVDTVSCFNLGFEFGICWHRHKYSCQAAFGSLKNTRLSIALCFQTISNRLLNILLNTSVINRENKPAAANTMRAYFTRSLFSKGLSDFREGFVWLGQKLGTVTDATVWKGNEVLLSRKSRC